MFLETIKVTYTATTNRYKAMQILTSLKDEFACDFEVASRLSEADKVIMQEKYELEDSELLSTPFSHPSLTMITHLSVADSIDKGSVIICENEAMRQLVYNFLVTTDKKQVWWNGVGYDFKRILYATGKVPKNWEDVMLLDKSLHNHAGIANYKLKSVMGTKYGAWGLSKDIAFTKENMHNPQMLLYSATDATACFCRWLELKNTI